MPQSSVTPAITLEELRTAEAPADLAEAARREKKLKAQVAELVATLEKLSRNSEHRHQQSAEFVNDLKKANRCGNEKGWKDKDIDIKTLNHIKYMLKIFFRTNVFALLTKLLYLSLVRVLVVWIF